MQLIKSLRSFGRWLFNIKDEVNEEAKKGDLYINNLNEKTKVKVTKIEGDFVWYRLIGSVTEQRIHTNPFHVMYRKIS